MLERLKAGEASKLAALTVDQRSVARELEALQALVGQVWQLAPSLVLALESLC